MPTEEFRRQREMVQKLRAQADELEQDLPPEYRQPPAGPQRKRRHLKLIEGTGVAAAVTAAGRWAHDNTAAAALMVAGSSVAAGLVLSPYAAPLLPGIGGDRDGAAPTVTRTVPGPTVRAPAATVTDSPSTAGPSPTPTGSPPPTEVAEPSPTPEPTPTATTTAQETGMPIEPPVSIPPPDITEPDPPDPPAETADCRVQLALPPLLRVRLICPADGGRGA